MTPRELPFGTWPSPVTAAMVAGAQIGLASPWLASTHVWWCEGRPAEGGRVALMRRDRRLAGPAMEVTPAGFSLRTRVNEYGGRAYTVRGELVVACDFADQRLYRLDPAGLARPLTPESGSRLRYAEPLIDAAHAAAIAVREDHRGAGEPLTTLVAVPLEGGPNEGLVLHEGSDFCAAPALSRDGRRLAWITWSHPDMPWDATCLRVAELGADGRPGDALLVAGGGAESVLQPLWLEDGSLVFASDRSGWWNLYRWDGRTTTCLHQRTAEFAGPLWSLGTRWHDAVDATTLAATFRENGVTRLAWVDTERGSLEPVPLDAVELSEPSGEGGAVAVIAAPADAPPVLLLIERRDGSVRAVAGAGEMPLGREWISRPQPVRLQSVEGRDVHAFYYAPTNPGCRAPAGDRPPLIVRSHGGPTGAAGSGLSLAIQFWTSRGFAVVDVNYAGSSGFGRAYRQALNGKWGLADVEDCIAAARHLVGRGLADPERLAIRGGSAAGFTTLCALTFHDVFKVGASYYGIGDLEALARDTHKFECRYLDRLVGPWPEAAETYRARSPIHHVDRLACPVIFFQGLDDAAVPPNQAEAMVAALRRKGLPVAYLAFPGEGHGFRKAETVIAALEAEHAFFCRVLGLAPAEGLAPLEIENL
jgi:dipeptidyl aminopeptidase/acylaminoacyl peptidase